MIASVRLTLVLALLGTGTMGCRAPDKRTNPAPPNVLIVVFDTLRADRMSLYGHTRETTPTIDHFAHDAVIFDAAYAPTGLTGPSHATLFTGLHPFVHGTWNNGITLDDNLTTLAETFSRAGYQTGAVVSSFVLDRRFGFAQGFDHYDDAFFDEESTIREESWRGHALEGAFDRRADHTSDRAIEWLKNRKASSPFFLFVHYFDPHSPYEPPAPFRNQFVKDEQIRKDPIELIRAWYDGEVRYSDSQFRRVLETLRDEGLHENTIVVVTADHGEGLMQHGYVLHGLKIFEEELRVPLLISWPGMVHARRVSAPVRLADIAPTLESLADLTGGDRRRDGLDLSPVLRGSVAPDPDRPIYSYRRKLDASVIPPVLSRLVPVERDKLPPPIYVNGEQFGLRIGDWKYVIAPDEGHETLFNLRTDPLETNNRVEEQRARADAMRGKLEQWIGARPPLQDERSGLSEEERARLRALGYVH